jgi:hypothetical protein
VFKQSIIQYPNGRFGFVGSGIPVELSYKRRDGAKMSADDCDRIAHCGIIGNMKETYATVAFETREEAAQAWREFTGNEIE